MHGVAAAAGGALLVAEGDLLDEAEGFRVFGDDVQEALVLL
jgi:hypothetical protein